LNCAASSGIGVYEIYGELSNEIHGAPWAGPSLKILSSKMSEKTLAFIKCLAADMNFDIEEVFLM